MSVSESDFVHFTDAASVELPVLLRKKDEEAYKTTIDQQQRLTNDTLNTFETERSFKQFVVLWLIFMTVIVAVLIGFTFPMHHNVQHLLDIH